MLSLLTAACEKAHLHTKAYLCALVLTLNESRKFKSVSQGQSNRNAPKMYNIFSWILEFIPIRHEWEKYIHRCGLSALLVSTNRAMREPIQSGTSDRTGSTLFVFMLTNKIK